MAKGTKVGEILLEQGLIDEDQLQHALNEHRRTGLMLGKVIVRLGFVDEDTMASILGEQISLKQKKRLGDILIEQGIVNQGDVDEALAMQKRTGQKLGKCLVELNKITGEQLLNVLSAQLDIPQVKLKNYHFDHGAVALITEEMSRTHKVVPLYVRGKTLTIAMVDPTDMRTVDYLRFKTQMNVESVMATEDDINKAIESLYGVQNTGIDELIGEDKAAAKPEETPDANADDLDFTSEEGRKIVAIVNSIISEAVNGGVSDIHLEPEDNYLRLRYRTDGELSVRSTIPHTLSNAVLSRFKILASMDIAEKRKPQDGRITIKLSGHEVDLRVSSFPVSLRKRGVMEKIVIRILDPEKNQFSLDDMGMLPVTLKRLRAGIRLPNGIILVTGPTGSGKSTTLYACIREINRPEVNISTMEDP
ncbi:MAG: Flp pilus assembly complex ATPase component TadA, partial [Fibrobacterales bacterium]|nr:Flp pilus assembly complex ATPase component TadA [Fibrobacterales bacterium]